MERQNTAAFSPKHHTIHPPFSLFGIHPRDHKERKQFSQEIADMNARVIQAVQVQGGRHHHRQQNIVDDDNNDVFGV